MRTLIVSDLHLGSAAGVDLLRRPELRAQLLEALADVDRLVLLGDLLELRHGPRREALAAARPFFEELGRVMGAPPAREIVAVAGNHDHALIEPWLEHRSELPAPAPLGVEQRIEASAASSMMALLAEWAAPARLRRPTPVCGCAPTCTPPTATTSTAISRSPLWSAWGSVRWAASCAAPPPPLPGARTTRR